MLDFFRKGLMYVVVISGLILGFGLWNTYKNSGVNTEPTALQLADARDNSRDPSYATVVGGALDLKNAYEYSVTLSKAKIPVGAHYFVPVVDPNNPGSPVYVVQVANLTDLVNASGETRFTGLLQSVAEMPQSVATAFGNKYPGVGFRFLDATFKPKTVWQRLFSLRYFFIAFVCSVLLYAFLGRFRKRENPVEQLEKVVDEVRKGSEEDDRFETIARQQNPGLWKATTAVMWLLFFGFVGVSLFNQYPRAVQASQVLASASEVPAKVVDIIPIDGGDKGYAVDLQIVHNETTKDFSLIVPEVEYKERFRGAATIPVMVDSAGEYNLKSYYQRNSNRPGFWFKLSIGYLVVLILLVFGRYYLRKAHFRQASKQVAAHAA